MENSDSQRFIHYSGSLFLFAAAVAIVWQIIGPTWFRNIKAEITNQPYARTVTVTAEGKITAKPDIALIDLSVVSQGKTVKQVTTDNNQKMNQVIDAVKKLGIEEKDITTTQYNLSPDYRYPMNGGAPQITGYRLDQQLHLKIRKLEIVDDVLDSGIKAGSNQVGQLTFDIDDASNVKKEARQQAFAKARQKAEEMANAVGVKLGRVVTFSESGEMQPPVFANYAMEAKSMDMVSNPSIQPGSKELNLNVNVTYEIE